MSIYDEAKDPAALAVMISYDLATRDAYGRVLNVLLEGQDVSVVVNTLQMSIKNIEDRLPDYVKETSVYRDIENTW